jgi:hypothetical protein
MAHFEPGDLVQWNNPYGSYTGTVVVCFEESDRCNVRIESATNPPRHRFEADVGEETVVPMSILKKPINNAINRKAKNQAIRNVVEKRMGISGEPGHGPADLIRKFAGISLTKGARGGKKNKTRRARK